MLDKRDPEYRQNCELAKLVQDENWRDGLIGDDTYLRSLLIIGYELDAARAELARLKEKKNASVRGDGQRLSGRGVQDGGGC